MLRAGIPFSAHSAKTSCPAWRVSSHEMGADQESEGPTVNRCGDPGFVGRARELEQLLLALGEASSGHGKLLCLLGEPGIGKTRLAAEFASRARTRGAQVAWASTLRTLGGTAPPYWLWIQVLRDRSLEKDSLELARRFKFLPTLIDGGEEGEATDGGIHDSRLLLEPFAQSVRLFDATAEYLATISRISPLVIVLDDIAIADRLSLLALGFFASRLSEVPILIVATFREAEVRYSGSVSSPLCAAGVPGRHVIPLSFLSSREVADLVEVHTRRRPAHELARRVESLTRGNPLFIELLLAEESLLHVDPETPTVLPHELRSAAAQHLDLLSKMGREVLSTAAVVGREFDLACVQAASDLAAEDLLDVLVEAQRVGLLEETKAPGGYRFSHPLVWQALYESLSGTLRAQLHHRVGRFLRKSFGHDRERLRDIARHFHAALPIGSARDAVEYSVRAAEHSTERARFKDGARLYEMALAAVAASPTDEAPRCELLLKIAEARAKAGDSTAAREDFRQASELAHALGDHFRFARAALGRAGFPALAAADPDWEIVSMLTRALQLQQEDGTLRVQLLLRLAAELHAQSDAAAYRWELEREAEAIASRLKDPRARFAVLFHRHLFQPCAPHQIDQQVGESEKMLDIALAHGDDFSEERVMATVCRICSLLRKGVCDALAPMPIRTGFNRLPKSCVMEKEHLFHAALPALLEGRFREAAMLISRSLESTPATFGAEGADLLWPALIVPFRELGKLAELEAPASGAVERYPRIPVFRILRTRIRSLLGKVDQASEEFEEMADRGFETLPRDVGLLTSLTALAELCVELGNERRAAQLYDLLQPQEGLNAVFGPLAFFGPASMYLGMLLTLLGKFERAVEHFEGALRSCMSLGARPWQAYVEYHYARACAERGDAAEMSKALGLLSHALGLAQQLAMSDLTRRLLQLSDLMNRRAPERSAEEVLSAKFSATNSEGAEIRNVALQAGAANISSATDGNACSIYRIGAETERSAELPPGNGAFIREGDYWTVVFGQKLLRLRHTKGLACIAHLLRHPGQDFHVADLAATVDGIRVESIGREAARLGADELPARQPGRHDSGPILDASAKSAYRQRIRDLSDELEEAKAFNDFARAAKIENEISFVIRELSSAIGLGGEREKRLGSEVERARVSVTNAVRSTLQKIRREHPPLARYLAGSIRTGRFCSFRPDARFSCTWRV